MTIEYQVFATALSVALVILYAALAAIALRRARRGHGGSELIAIHARRVESPLFTALLLTAIALTLSALFIRNTVDGQALLRLALAFVRGVLLAGGTVVLVWYWQVRSTWLR